jgi:hypothetical protein
MIATPPRRATLSGVVGFWLSTAINGPRHGGDLALTATESADPVAVTSVDANQGLRIAAKPLATWSG